MRPQSTMPTLLVGVLVALALGTASETLACASCGSGGDSPLVLYPNEPYKTYLGISQQSHFETVYADGTVARDNAGPERRTTVLAAFGASFSPDWFATLTVPYITNVRADRDQSGLGDVLAYVHWTVHPTSMLAPSLPQVQLFAGYKTGAARSVYDYEDDAQLDAYGTGFPEARAGVDLWWGSTAFQYGLAEVASLPFAKSYSGASRTPGRETRTTATVGYSFGEKAKLRGGATLAARSQRMADKQRIQDSEELDHGLFLTGDWQASERNDVRLTYARSAAFGRNKNATRADTMTVAVMRVL